MPQTDLADVPDNVKQKEANLKWAVRFFEASDKEAEAAQKTFKEVWDENDEKYPIVARIVDTTMNKNRWGIPKDEIEALVAQVTERQLRINHSKNDVMEIIGKFEAAEKDGDSIIARGVIMNEYVARLVHTGAVTDFSISATSDDVLCS